MTIRIITKGGCVFEVDLNDVVNLPKGDCISDVYELRRIRFKNIIGKDK